MQLLEMEEKLAADPSGTYRDSVLTRLDDHAAEIKRAVDRGLPPDEYRRMAALSEGLDAARRTVSGAWARYNPS